MSVICSYSLWSSIKIPLSMYAGKKKKETQSPVPYVDFCFKMNQKNSETAVKEITNLRVPNPLKKAKEYSIPEIFNVGSKKKMRYRKKIPQKINFLRVPDFDAKPNKRAGEFYINPGYKPRKEESENLNLEEKFLELSFERDKGEFVCVPSIKPWTLEELNELHRRYGTKDGEAITTGENKKNKRLGMTKECAYNVSTLTNKILNLKIGASRKPLNSKINEELDSYDSEFYDCEQDPTDLESDLNPNEHFLTSNYSKMGPESTIAETEAKLAELYMCEFDIKG